MAWRIPTSSTTSLINADLSTTDNLYISTGVTIGSTNSAAVYGAGDHHKVWVYGTAVGGFGVYLVGDYTTPLDNTVYVAPLGRIDSIGSTAVYLVGSRTTVGNAGYIYANSYGIVIGGTNASTVSTINNAGTIDADYFGIYHPGGMTETLQLNNSGLLKSKLEAYVANDAVAKDLITNTGTIIGEIHLGGGEDVYNGINGHQTGLVSGEDGADKLYGGTEANTFHGNAGADSLAGYGGNDILYGDAGTDILNGGFGADDLSGGLNADQFVYSSISESTVAVAGQDDILDFSHAQGDKINLALIDARSATAANEAFSYIGTAAFTGIAGQLHYQVISGQTYVSGDVNGDKVADFQIHLAGAIALTAADFIL